MNIYRNRYFILDFSQLQNGSMLNFYSQNDCAHVVLLCWRKYFYLKHIFGIC